MSMSKRLGVSLLVVAVMLGCIVSLHAKAAAPKAPSLTTEQRIGVRFSMPREGKEAVDLNLYLLNDGKDHPLVITLHGGAFVLGSADAMDTQNDRISKAWDVNVVAVDYKLLDKEHHLATGTEEVVDTIRYFREHAAEYHIDPDEIFVMGCSAGAYYGTAATLALKQEGIDVAGQIICYGYLKENDLTYLAMDKAARASTAPALFILADNDLISDSSLNYQRSLAANGVATQVQKYPGTKHAFLEGGDPEQDPSVREAEELIGDWIHSTLAK